MTGDRKASSGPKSVRRNCDLKSRLKMALASPNVGVASV